MRLLFMIISSWLALNSNVVAADQWAEGVPISIQKTDYASLHLIFIAFSEPVKASNSCSSSMGLVVHDANESSQAALTLALTALASGKKFRCYVTPGTSTNDCSQVNGSSTTFPVCDYYPSLAN